ncbi:uncharacterized protein LOC132295993 [Cornus florida]|uniref:uncharacterized protein LOC132295993 n=1 Tax=Cornus florida TaxID=4283 RepID=UPI00289C5DF4|nr:uncharacterized protein LOC132295993 [Cornus florida]
MSKESNISGVSKRDRLDWNAQMDDIFVDALHNQYLKGNMHDGTFTTRAYHEIVEELKQKLGIDINKAKVKNRLKTTKTRFNECLDLFKNGLSGFAWSQETKMWNAEPEVWADLTAAKPAAEKWKTATISNYDKLLDLFGKDRARGFNALTAKERMAKWSANDKEKNNESTASASERSNEWVPTHNDDPMDSIYGIDHLVSRNEASLDNTGFLDTEFEYMNMMSPETPSSVPSHSTSSSKGKRKRKSSTTNQDNLMIGVVSGVAESLKEGNELLKEGNELQKTFNNLYEKCNQKGKYEEDIFKELAAIGIEEHAIVDAFIFLTTHDHPDRVTQFLGCPFNHRKQLLEKLMSRASRH